MKTVSTLERDGRSDRPGPDGTGHSFKPFPAAALTEAAEVQIEQVRRNQKLWARIAVVKRLRTFRRLRELMVDGAKELAQTVPLEVPGRLHRTVADTLVAEVLPLIEACRFLEREAESILKPRRDTSAPPFWLRGVSVEVRREPFGIVLIIAPGNYPLLLPGVHALQALAAGNAVMWKPAPNGAAVPHKFKSLLVAAGLDPMLFQVLDSSVDAANEAIRSGVDKVILTGSAKTGRAVLRELAETLTPAVMELSGCDAVFVLDDADLDRAAAAIAFGLGFNGSATCMAPRRLFASPRTARFLRAKLLPLLETINPIPLAPSTAALIQRLLADAELNGAKLACGGIVFSSSGPAIRPMLIVGEGAAAALEIARTDIDAPVLLVIEVADEESAAVAYEKCPYALSVAVFGEELHAAKFAKLLRAGVALVNDIIVSTADPRAPFGGRGQSGFGVTRGREGLLATTTVKTLLIQRSRSLKSYEPTTAKHADLFLAYLGLAHGSHLRSRAASLLRLGKAAMSLGKTRHS